MSDWENIAKADVIDWLLEEDNPSVRFFTLTDIIGRSAKDPDVTKAKSDIISSKIVSKIFSKQNKQAYWEEPDRFYTAKYKGTAWQLIILAELGLDKKNEQIKKAAEFILQNSQETKSGAFSMTKSKTSGGLPSAIIPCLTGNMVWSLIKFGYLDDPRVRYAINWLTTYQRFDDGNPDKPKDWPYNRWEACWGRHSCHMGVVKTLKALSEIPPRKRTKAVKNTIEQGAEFLLMHHIHKRSHDLNRDSKPGWKKFGFPLMYQTDILEILGILTKLGYRDSRMQEAIDLVISKQDSSGRWILENTFNGRFQTNIEQKGKPSKWLTLNALRILKRLNS